MQSTFPPQIYSLDIGRLKLIHMTNLLKYQSRMEYCPAQLHMCFTGMDHALCQPKKITKWLDPQVGKKFLDQTEADSQSWKTDFSEERELMHNVNLVPVSRCLMLQGCKSALPLDL